MKSIIMTLLLLCSILSFGTAQDLKPGTLVGLHTVKPILKTDDATVEGFIEVMSTKGVEVYEEAFEGMTMRILTGIRGDCKDCVGQLVIATSEAVRNIYWNEDGSVTEAGQKAMEKVQAGLSEALEMYDWESAYTDWVVE